MRPARPRALPCLHGLPQLQRPNSPLVHCSAAPPPPTRRYTAPVTNTRHTPGVTGRLKILTAAASSPQHDGLGTPGTAVPRRHTGGPAGDPQIRPP
ncbi:hypothetical protein STRTUCAR8_08041 [Streptomyces turgidiscabies Car8]|uniref:Uncharacterized protein n=1 Tax=Streptomyces turgidiscabies (strain Car8) TaxID=698760 RepID=L7EVL7_STRT8|nr:hypothetical protein STRTUCAR8_08041 [Streptomyces turgidiscabies Car8]